MTLMNILSWILFGLIVGVIARFLLPGRQSMGWIATIVLGVIGSFVGGTIASFLFDTSGGGIHAGSWIASILGAILVLAIYIKFAK
jgi:uncharacterized membrane protein YeaQ/YmgE (transglycosylase-associated protein family)